MKTKVLASVLAILLFAFADVAAQTAMKSPTIIPTPAKIKRLVKGNITEVKTIDFNGDRENDFIVRVRNNNPIDSDVYGTEFWINSAMKIVKRETWYNASADFKWFINLDSDATPEIISAFGYEDGIAYSVFKQDFKSGKDVLLFQFSPVLVDASRERKHFWGYPWDLIDVKAKRKGNYYELLCSFNHNVEGDFTNVKTPKWQRRIPVIFFNGKTTQPDSVIDKDLGTMNWMNAQIVARNARRN